MNKNTQIEHPMIEVDGVMRHRHNSLGQPIHPTDEGIRNFHRWFIGSTAVDEHGRPQVFYHGTNSEFSIFDPDKNGEATGKHLVPRSTFVFSDSPVVANTYATSRIDIFGEPEYKHGGNVKPVYLNIHKLMRVDAKGENWNAISRNRNIVQTNDIFDEAKKKGYDGVRISNVKDSHKGIAPKSTVYAVFDNNRIKSSIGNSGEFSIFSKNISESVEHPMIEVDGVMRNRHNSLGQPIHPTDEGIRNFHRWFSGSDQVDEHGRPKVFYHGSNFADPLSGESFAKHKGVLWVSETPELANQYAEARYDRGAPASVMPVYIRSMRLFNGDTLHNPRVSDFYAAIKAQSPDIDYKELGDLHDITQQGRHEEESGPVYEKHNFWHEPYFFFGSKGANAIHAALKLGGFDGIKSTENVSNYVNGDFVDSAHKTIGIFHPSDAKSVIGNSGKFSKESDKLHEATMSLNDFLVEANEGNYVAISAIIPDEIKEAVNSIKMSVEPIEEKELHATLVYSKGTTVDDDLIKKMLSKGKQEFSGTIKHVTKFDAIAKDGEKPRNECTIVLEIESYDLEKLHKKLLNIGLGHSHDEYRPHVSIVYNIPIDEAVSIIKKLEDIVVGKEIKFSGFIVDNLRN